MLGEWSVVPSPNSTVPSATSTTSVHRSLWLCQWRLVCLPTPNCHVVSNRQVLHRGRRLDMLLQSVKSELLECDRMVLIELLVDSFIPTKVIIVYNKVKPWFNDWFNDDFNFWTTSRMRLIFGGQTLGNWDEFVQYQRWANKVLYWGMFRNRDVLMNTHCPHQWWSTLKSTVLARDRLFLLLVCWKGKIVVSPFC